MHVKQQQKTVIGLPLSLVLVCVSILVIALSWQVLKHIEGKTHASITSVLQASLQHSHSEIKAWVSSRKEDAKSWGESAALREKIQILMDTPSSLRQQSPVQDDIWALLAPMVDRLGYRGVTIVNSLHQVVSSLEPQQVGSLHPMDSDKAWFSKVFAGETRMSNPLHAVYSWSNTQDSHAFFIAAPMRDDESGMMVAIVFEMDPEGKFSDIAAHGRIGETGETWFFNQQGWMISKSRFETELQQQGQLKTGQSSLLHIQTTQRKAAKNTAFNKKQLHQAFNYLQKEVVFVSTWDAKLDFGLLTSIESQEAFAPLYRTQKFIVVTVLLIVVLLLTLSVFVWLVQQRKNSEVEESSSQLRSVLDASPDAILVFNQHGNMVDMNSQASRLLKCPENSVIHLPFERLSTLTLQHLQQAQAGEAVNIEDYMLMENAVALPVDIRLRSISNQHQKGYVIAIIQDLTMRKDAEEEQQRLEYAQRLESLGVLAGGIAHDFNNILMTVIGNTALIRGRLPDADASTVNLTRIETASRRAADLCKQMLAYSGQGQFVVQTVDLSEQLQDISKLMEVSVSKKIPLQLDLANKMPKCDCDISQLQQIMLNLLTNANEAIGDNKGTISVRTGTMLVDESWLKLAQESEKAAAGEFVFIEVQDDGEGMSTEVQEHIFEPFFTTKFTGRGLGMSAVQGIMRGHEGALYFQSEQGSGSVFRIVFPVSEAYIEPVANPPSMPMLAQGGLVLVVDDESDVRSLLCDMLHKIGYEALIAENGKQAVEVYQKHQHEIEFVLLDLMMPEMNGDECLIQLKSINPQVHAILSSGYSEPLVSAHLNKAKAQGIIDDVDFLQKPYDMNQLTHAIQLLKL